MRIDVVRVIPWTICDSGHITVPSQVKADPYRLWRIDNYHIARKHSRGIRRLVHPQIISCVSVKNSADIVRISFLDSNVLSFKRFSIISNESDLCDIAGIASRKNVRI